MKKNINFLGTKIIKTTNKKIKLSDAIEDPGSYELSCRVFFSFQRLHQ